MPTFSTTNHALQFGNNAPTVSVYGTDISGYIFYQMSGSFFGFEPGTKYLAGRLTFGTPYGSAPTSVTLTPANSYTQQVLASTLAIGFYVDGGNFPGDSSSDLHAAYFNISGISTTTAILGPGVLAWYYEVSTGVVAEGGGGGGGAVDSVGNNDNTLTVSPNTGGVIASLNLTHANTWTAKQTFSSHLAVDGYTIDLSGNAAANQVLRYNGTSFVASNDSVVNSDGSLTISPNFGAVIASLNVGHANTFSAKQTFNGHIAIDGYTLDLSGGATTNQVLQYNGTSFIPTAKTLFIGEVVSSGTTGSALFLGSGGILAQDNANFFWDAANKRLGLGINTPGINSASVDVPDIIAHFTRLTGSNHSFLALEGRASNLDAGLIFYTLTGGLDSALFLDESDSQKLKIAMGSVDTDSGRNSNAKLTLQQNGMLGLGTSSPQATAHIIFNDSADGGLILDGGRSSLHNQILFRNSFWTENTTAGMAYIRAIDDTSQGGILTFATTTNSSGAGGIPTERMRIDNNGFVGFGTTPTTYFDLFSNTNVDRLTPTAKITNTGGSTTLALIGNSSNSNKDTGFTFYDGSTLKGDMFFNVGTGGMIVDHTNGVGFRTLPGFTQTFAIAADGGIEFTNSTSAALSASSAGRIRYNSTSQHFEISENGGSYSQISTGGGGGSTFASVYNTGSSASDATALIQSGHGGPIIFKANGTNTGSLVQAKKSDGTVLMDITDNNTMFFLSQAVGGAQFVANSTNMADNSFWAFGNANNGYNVVQFTHNATSVPPHTTFATTQRFGDGASAAAIQTGTGLFLWNGSEGDASYSTAVVIDTSFSWSDPAGRLLSIRNGGGAFSGSVANERFGFCGDGGMQFKSGTAAVSDSGTGRIRFSSASSRFEVSENGGIYAPPAANGFKPFFSGVDWAAALASTAGVGAGDYSNGVGFAFSKNVTILGIRWYQQVGNSLPVKASLWNATTDVRLAFKTVTSPTQGAINTALFATPYSYTVTEDRLSITVYDGTNQLLYTGSGNLPMQAEHAWGYGLYFYGNGQVNGDDGTVISNNQGYIGIEPIYTIP